MKVLIVASVLVVLILTVGVCFGDSTADEIYKKGVEYGVQGEFKKAKEEFEKALKVDQFFMNAKKCLELTEDSINQKIKEQTAKYLFRGVDYGNKGMLDEAIAEFNKAITNDPDYALAYNGRGIIYAWSKGQYDQGISDYNKALEINPKYPGAYLNRGIAYLRKGQYDKAISDFNKALEINPKFPEAYLNRGLTYEEGKGQYDQAISDYNKALEINPKFAEAYFNRGLAYRRKNQYDQAISDYNKALEINPKLPQAYDNLGFLYMVKLGDKSKACSYWKRACELGLCENYELAKREGDCK